MATSKMPLVIIRVLAIPSTAPKDNWSDVPLTATLYKLAVPLREEVPVNVAVPADALKLPLTVSTESIEKPALVVTEPAIANNLKFFAPAPDIVFEVPLMVIVPALAAKLPLTDRFPVSIRDVSVLTDPVMVRLSSEIPKPLIVLLVPVINKVPPETWLNEPEPVVARLPVTVMFPVEKLTAVAVTVRLLKFCAPDPLITVPAPVNVTFPVLPS